MSAGFCLIVGQPIGERLSPLGYAPGAIRHWIGLKDSSECLILLPCVLVLLEKSESQLPYLIEVHRLLRAVVTKERVHPAGNTAFGG